MLLAQNPCPVLAATLSTHACEDMKHLRSGSTQPDQAPAQKSHCVPRSLCS